MPIRTFSTPIPARGVQVTSSDDFIAQYTLGRAVNVVGVQISVRPTAGVPTAAQLQGVTRCIAYKGIAKDPKTDHMSLFASDYIGIVFLDSNVGVVNTTDAPRIWCSPTFVEAQESFSVQVCRGVAVDGSGMDVDIALTPLVEYLPLPTDTQGYRAV